MRRSVMVMVAGVVVGCLAGLGAWYAFAPEDAAPTEEVKPALDEWLQGSEQEMLLKAVEDAREGSGWAAGCLWREDGDIRELIFPPIPAIADEGVLPSGRYFSILGGPGQSTGQYMTIEADEHFCIVPAGRGSGGEDIVRAPIAR